ncbi:uncharacterized protein LOC124266557 [Haliotis rubra]|uniref:uncharacterized protein LOC124266557 n=1 Tax=Haliotis rubra TaxID=36100 RepID=UPI001EE5C13F|nr:uncharacterized protein LOC124266557 [Haliotis rubra]
MDSLMPIKARGTPVKNVTSCVCCGKAKNDGGGQFYRIECKQTKATENSLAILLERYGGLMVVHGYACRKCHDRVKRIHTLTKDFWDMCQESSKSTKTKRCASSPLTPSVSNEPMISNHRKVQRRLIMSAEEHTSSSLSGASDPDKVALIDEIGYECNVSTTKRDYHDHTYFKDPDNSETGGKNCKITSPNMSRTLGSSRLLANSLINCDASLRQSLTCSDIYLLTEAINSFSVFSAAEAVMKIPHLKSAIEKHFLQKVDHSVSELNRRNVEHGYVSELMAKDYNNLSDFKWQTVVEEIAVKSVLDMVV